MARIRFCAYEYAHRPIENLIERWRRAEVLGFDVLWNCDAMNEPDTPGRAMFEATSILAAMAVHTSTIRVGTLVNTLIYRNPAAVAKAAMTIDHLAGGRLELGYGGGVLHSDHDASGVEWWEARDRIARFREAVTIIDGMLTNDVFSYEGKYYAARNAEMAPRPIQDPRPPLTIPAHGPGMLRIAAEFADGWSSWGGYDIETEQQMYTVTRDRSARFDDFCSDVGRDPKSIWHSLVVFPPLQPWESAESFIDMVGRYGAIGIDEFVLYFPQNWREAPKEEEVFEQVALEVMPGLREEGLRR